MALHSLAAGYMLPVGRESRADYPGAPGAPGAQEKDMKRLIVLALCAAVGLGLALIVPEVRVYSSDKESRFPQLKMEQLNDPIGFKRKKLRLPRPARVAGFALCQFSCGRCAPRRALARGTVRHRSRELPNV